MKNKRNKLFKIYIYRIIFSVFLYFSVKNRKKFGFSGLGLGFGKKTETEPKTEKNSVQVSAYIRLHSITDL